VRYSGCAAVEAIVKNTFQSGWVGWKSPQTLQWNKADQGPVPVS